ncbi:hypothetical protein BAE44_0002769 [Dichanthelium oligosanthes]|uniref:Uncharacterized protein n=1 Tax=Dichanthelium oligosanthes TaxID=888268 RepID=A0A1E5WFP7_9POAL|nr:hypothetical protein BAE44_0002769 [Dichanthelium oligosanthes]
MMSFKDHEGFGQVTAGGQATHGNLESGGKGEKAPEHSTTIALQSPFPEYNGCFEIGLGQSMAPSNYSCADQCYGMLTTYGMRSMVWFICFENKRIF